MAVKSDVTIKIKSSKLGVFIELIRFTEFDVDIDLETDADAFDFVAKNPNGMYSSIFSKFDPCVILLNGEDLMYGHIDSITYIIKDNDDYIKISGRDLCWKFVDNDALPDTILNVKPEVYIASKCKEYSIKYVPLTTADVFDKLVIGCNESEVSIMNNILLDSKQRLWFIKNVLYSGMWSTDAQPSYIFVKSNKFSGTQIKTIELIEDGADMKSDVLIYGSDSTGVEKMVGSAKNIAMHTLGIIKRKVRRYYSDKASTKYTQIAEKDMRDLFQNNIQLTLRVRIDEVYFPNKTARVVIDKLGVDSIFFIKAIKYVKSIDEGTYADLKMIPSDASYEKIWQSTTNNSVTNMTVESSKIMR